MAVRLVRNAVVTRSLFGIRGLKGLFDGEHIFRIEPLGPGRVRFVQEESFAGVYVPLLKGTLG